MTRHQLFNRLCAVTDAPGSGSRAGLQAEIAREDESAHQLALSAVVDQLDVLIDELVDADILPSGREPLFWDLPIPCAPDTKERA